MAIHGSQSVLLVCLVVALTMSSVMSTIYLKDLCNQNHKVSGEVRIKLLHDYTYRPVMDCTLTLIASSGSRLTARFLSYTQGETWRANKCENQAIYLNNYFDPNGYCLYSKPSTNYDLGKIGTYRYMIRQPNVLSTNAAKAELLVTEVTNKTGVSCPPGFFDCEYQNECIDDDLTCNGNDNCGNNRDEIEGCGLTPGIIVGIVFGIIGFIVIVIIGVLLFIKFR